jgi:hypothetical protein
MDIVCQYCGKNVKNKDTIIESIYTNCKNENACIACLGLLKISELIQESKCEYFIYNDLLCSYDENYITEHNRFKDESITVVIQQKEVTINTKNVHIVSILPDKMKHIFISDTPKPKRRKIPSYKG